MVISRTPLRVSFVGGGTDLPEFCAEHGGAVISATIDKYVYVAVHDRFDGGVRASYSRTEEVGHRSELRHQIIREAMYATGVESAEITTISDVPAGTGLGSSGAVAVGVVNALGAHMGNRYSPVLLANLAMEVESTALGSDVGRQDQWAAAYGGVRFYEFGALRTEMEPVSLPVSYDLERHTLLLYTGRQHRAQEILEQIAYEADDDPSLLLALRAAAKSCRRNLKTASDSTPFIEAINYGWAVKRLLPGVSNDEIDALVQKALEAGAEAAKLLGAGGGGFLMVYVKPEYRANVIAATGLRELPARFTVLGSTIVYQS